MTDCLKLPQLNFSFSADAFEAFFQFDIYWDEQAEK